MSTKQKPEFWLQHIEAWQQAVWIRSQAPAWECVFP